MAGFIRNYEVIKELGTGHFGSVCLAVGDMPGRGLTAGKRRVVAIKRLNDRANPDSLRLLRQEFALLDQVKHRGIVRVFEYIESENAVVMEYVHGVTLRKVLEECARAREQVFTEAVVEIACEIADALYQAHTTPGDNGEPLLLVHRDLKPDNVMLTPHGEVKILDFGLARVDNKDFAKDDPNRIRGTPLYMAPEQARGEGVDHRTDLFALGLITYELLMNRAAYRVSETSPDPVAEVYDAIERANLAGCVAELETKVPAMGPIIARCLQARVKNRYQTGQELLVDLRRQLYRDRGAYLMEFCEFFFGSIHDLEEMPATDDLGVPLSTTGGGGRMSIEDRLRQSMEREKVARAQAGRGPSVSPSPVFSAPDPSTGDARRAPRARPFVPTGTPPPPGRPAPAPAGRPAPAPAGRPAPASAGKPVGAPPARPSTSGDSASGKPRIIGARSPDETGMMEVMPLDARLMQDQTVHDPSATAFFAMPAPKAERPQPAMSPMPAASGAAYAPSPAAPQPYSPGGQPPPPPPPVTPMVQGPVAAYGNAAQGGSPFQVAAGPVAPPSAESSQRVQSNRVYAVILAVMMLTGVAIAAAVWFRPSDKKVEPEVAQVTQPERPPEDPPPPEEPEAPAEPVKPRVSTGAPKTPTAPATPKPEPPSARGTLTVRMTDQSPVTGISIYCPSGTNKLASLKPGGTVSVPDVPNENCTLNFRGGTAGVFSPVHGGQSISCQFQGSTVICR